MNIEEMLSREAIRHTVSRYNSAVDRGAYQELAHVFAADGIMTFGGRTSFNGRDAIISSLRAGAEGRGAFDPANFQRHLLGNSIINIVDDKAAKSVHYILVITELGLDHTGVYIDEFVRSGDHWLLAKRNANLEWIRPDSRFFLYPGPVTASKELFDIWSPPTLPS